MIDFFAMVGHLTNPYDKNVKMLMLENLNYRL